MKRRTRKVGDIVKIPLGNGYYGFGQVLNEPLVAFFNIRSKHELPATEILESDIAFAVWVMNHAVTKDWPVIGNCAVKESVDQTPAFFKRDPQTGALSITHDGGDDIPATLNDVRELEPAAVWEPGHIVDRLNDHFAGRPNFWLQRMKP